MVTLQFKILIYKVLILTILLQGKINKKCRYFIPHLFDKYQNESNSLIVDKQYGVLSCLAKSRLDR